MCYVITMSRHRVRTPTQFENRETGCTEINIVNIAILRADNSCQYQQSSQTGAHFARHMRPQTTTEAKPTNRCQQHLELTTTGVYFMYSLAF